MKTHPVHIVGGGLVGSLTAVMLAQRGFQTQVFERNQDIRKVKVSGGRSINLAVTSRGFKALEEVGLKNEVLKIALPMNGRMLHHLDGQTVFVPYGQKADEVIHSVSRIELNKLLLNHAESYKNVEIFFDHQCTGFDATSSTLYLREEKKEKKISTKTVIGTDGSASVLRQAIREHHKDFKSSEDFLEHGYKELVIPAGQNSRFLLEKCALHIWPRKRFMLIALPNLDGSFTATWFFSHKGLESFETLKTEQEVLSFFQTTFPDALELMPNITRDFFANPIGHMVTVKAFPWHIEGKLMLLGDAAHAIVPFFGQGMNCGFEDCTALTALLDHGNFKTWDEVFQNLESIRKPNADAIAEMALENFIEMRDTVADPKFQLKKEIGFELERRYQGQFIPRYSMVVFHPEISYLEAKNRSESQDKILEELCEGLTRIEEINWDLIQKKIFRLGL